MIILFKHSTNIYSFKTMFSIYYFPVCNVFVLDNQIIQNRQIFLIICMKLNKGDQILDIKTGNSQLSDIDLFSKLEANFLEKFFKYNLTDYFTQTFTNIFEDIFDRKFSSKIQRNVSSSLFFANHRFTISQFQNKIDQFYKSKSKSIAEQQLPFAFRMRYGNLQEMQSVIQSGQMILVDVKIKAEVQKIQEVPQKIIRSIQNLKGNKQQNMKQLQSIFTNYQQQNFNIFFIYFGDINFHLFNNQLYQKQTIKIFQRIYQLRIFVFFVSKQGLIECFRNVNKIQNLQYFNDLVIQFYELKRQKQRKRRQKIKPIKTPQVKGQIQKQKMPMHLVALGVVGVVGLITFGVAIKKLYF